MTESVRFDISKVVGQFLEQKKFHLFIYLIMEISMSFCDVMIPNIYGNIIDSLREDKKISELLVKLFGAWSGSQLSVIIMEYIDASFIPEIQTYVRTNLVVKFLDIYKENFSEPDVGEMIATIIKLPDNICSIVSQFRSFVVPCIFSVGATLFYLFSIHKKLGIAFLLGLLMIVFEVFRVINSCNSVSVKYDNAHQIVHEKIGDLLTNMINVYSADSGSDEIQKIVKYEQSMDYQYGETIKCATNARLSFGVVYTLIFGTINYTALKLYESKEISMGGLTGVFVSILSLLNWASDLSRELRTVILTFGVIRRTQRNLDKLTANIKLNNQVKLSGNLVGNIIIENLSVPKTPLKNFSLHINPREKIAIIGEIGSGKSSLIKSILKLTTYEGSIKIDGKEVRDIDSSDLRKQISYIPQTAVLFNRSIYDNILYGSDKTKSDVDNIVKKFGLETTVFRNRNFNDIAGKNGETLSGGQRQIVMLLRNMLSPKPILILDEPTASLNQEMKVFVMKILSNFNDRTIIIVSHDQQTIDYVDRVVEIKN